MWGSRPQSVPGPTHLVLICGETARRSVCFQQTICKAIHLCGWDGTLQRVVGAGDPQAATTHTIMITSSILSREKSSDGILATFTPLQVETRSGDRARRIPRIICPVDVIQG